MDSTRTSGGSSGRGTLDRATGSMGISTTRALRQLDADLEMLDRAEAMLREAVALPELESRMAFEITHRAALRAAGVVISRANRERRRPLPLHAWKALALIGGPHRDWAAAMEPFIAERDRLLLRDDAIADPVILSRHIELTAAKLREVREEVLGATLPQDIAALAG